MTLGGTRYALFQWRVPVRDLGLGFSFLCMLLRKHHFGDVFSRTLVFL